MLRRVPIAIVAAALLAAGTATIPASASKTVAASQTLTLTAGETLTVRCPTPHESWNRSGYPLVVSCPAGATTTTQPPIVTRTAAPSSTLPVTSTTTTTNASTTSTTSASAWSCTGSVPSGNPGSYAYDTNYCPATWPTQWADTTNLTGSNYAGHGYPYSGLGAYAIDGGDWSPICANSSGGIVGANDPTCVTPETQELQANSDQDFVITNNTPTNPPGSVTGFPAVGTYSYTGPLDDYASLTSSYTESMPVSSTEGGPNNANTQGWAMLETYYTEPGNPVNEDDYEVSIQFDFSGSNGDCPTTLSQNGSGTGWNYGVVANDINIDGTLWHLCDGGANHQSSGACPTAYPECGQLVFHEGCDDNALPHQTTASGTIDIKAMVQWLEDHDAPQSSGLSANQTWGSVDDPCSDPSQPANGSPGTYASYPYITPGSSVSSIGLGWEIVSTGGVPEQYSVSKWTVNATGSPAPCGTTCPTTTTVAPGGTGDLTPPASLMPDSIFNQPVTGDAVLPTSKAVVANIVAQYEGAYGSVGVNFNRPVYEATASTPNVSMSVQSGCNNFTSGGTGSTGTEVPIPSYAVQGNSSDNILTVYDPSANKVWEFWEAQPAGNGWSACWGGEATLSTFDGVFPYPDGETATGIANLATEITEADVASGSINHAIAFEVLGGECDYYIAPADRGDCSQSNSSYPAEGEYFRFAPGTAMPSGLTPFAQMVFKAISTYGMVVVDMGGAVMLEADMNGYSGFNGPWELEGNSEASDPINNDTGTTPEYQLVSGFPWNDLQAITPPQS